MYDMEATGRDLETSAEDAATGRNHTPPVQGIAAIPIMANLSDFHGLATLVTNGQGVDGSSPDDNGRRTRLRVSPLLRIAPPPGLDTVHEC